MRNRLQKHPNTDCFVNYNANPKDKITDDCVIRALSRALGEEWDEVLMGLYAIALKYKYSLTDKKCYERYLKSKGWIKCKQPRKVDNTKYTGKEWCEWLNQHREYGEHIIAHIGGHHIVCVAQDVDDDYKVFDTWNSTYGCIGNFFIKQG